ncbi:polysaccharide biosynthesis tyrosine autokinase [Bacteroides xylanisolvens]|uniref:non-specific protein-tyrosine kinase n=1 Tax=Bacteroides xylanisolvens TaxID=371601 RepID=A0AAW4SSU2_9BACE|nr:polysaccharide biosynthesis tyrosine autokinase [Bacteroides xylanisolvens]MCA4530959.1 polysaccharide biosynthesis tyrosine autokinase [Bacteroides xylanisolvens]MCA4548963.1 polysaccharide biosynthesis tyrosine autokinase [Bacteroides xylanisolvens]MCA4562461.1 polysaccharide biosynthesis tyrosine autokinase [Bacteroides xylanisolvens]MCA4567547.1 polysaccharide biosynthesis tyrosine autokinase [Bacteroides xylanisolvens]MCA4598022.1 polysaccharide biosynthesis tyrosine autokinase [Bacter
MKETDFNEAQESKEENIDVKELLFKYLIHWPWFVGAVVACLIAAWIYLYMSTPVYNISATVLIKDDKKGGSAGMLSGLESLGLDGMISSSQNIDNEIEVLRSKTIAKEVVEDLGLYISYTDEDEFPSKNMYKTSPVQVNLTPQEADLLEEPMIVEVMLQPQGSMDVNVKIGDDEYQKHFEKLPAVFPTDKGTLAFFLTPDSVLSSKRTSEETTDSEKTIRNITATINKPLAVAKVYCKNMTIEPTSKTTSVAVISLKNSNVERGKDFINKLLEMYNINTNNDKNEVAQKTAEFINERISIISKELGSTEKDLESFKRGAGITDLTSDAQIALTGSAEYEKKRVENQTQINLLQDLQRYMQNEGYEVLPSNIGLQDVNLAAAINRYNDVLVERKRLLRTSTENNPTIINLDTSISAMKENVQVSLDRVLRGLYITKADLDREANRYSRRISEAPGQEREFVSIARQQEIKAGLYLMLLQKREENAITLAATANNAKIIDDAIADDAPVSPRSKITYLIALILGVGIPVGVIYLLELTKFKIEGRADVEKLTSAPIVGDIPLTDEKQGAIAVFENQNNLMSETFRNVRTNLQFMLGNDKKVILVTSTVSGEGKSFISGNLAISLSLLGKKVVIVGLDIRKPGLNKVFNISKREQGITQYLANPEKNLMDLVQLSDVSKNLYILPGGTVPPNPTELLARDGLDKAIETLKENFDYVILDTAPVGMVTDTLLIGRVADLSVYVCRADYTRKNEYTLINELIDGNKLPNLCTVINGLDLKKRKYGYYYGYGKYGKYYGYGKRYGYGYGYGETSDNKEK